MAGIVLLDEDTQRALRRGSSSPPPMRRPYRMMASSDHDASTAPPAARQQQQDSMYSVLYPRPKRTSSPRTNFTSAAAAGGGSGGGGSGDLYHGDSVTTTSFPLLRHGASSAGDSDLDRREAVASANKYAGTSSGLHISVTWIMVGVFVGVALGISLIAAGASPLVARWVSLPGDLFLRALKCLVVPYVFCAVAVAIGDIVFVGKVSVVGLQTLKMFVLFWVSSAAIGMAIALACRPLFRVPGAAQTAMSGNAVVGLMCANGGLLTLSGNNTNTVSCNSTAAASVANSSVVDLPPTSLFALDDRNDVFAKTSTSPLTQFTLTTQLIAMIQPLVSDNIFHSLSNSDLLPVITFAMVLGAIAGRNYFTKTKRVNYIYLVLLQLRNTFFLAMEWIIWLSPIAVVSIISGSFASNRDALDKLQFSTISTYLLAATLAATVQMLVVFPLIVFLLARCNPYSHMAHMLRAYMFAFACSSSLATAPVTLTCVKKAKVCSQSLANFVISIGVCSNLSAVGWYIPIAIVFLAESSGNGAQLTWLRLVGVFVLSVLSCAGTPPIPSGVLVAIVTIYTALFGVSKVPETFVYVVAMDFVVDRLVTVCDVNDDIMCLKVVAENTDETVTQEHLGQRE